MDNKDNVVTRFSGYVLLRTGEAEMNATWKGMCVFGRAAGVSVLAIVVTMGNHVHGDESVDDQGGKEEIERVHWELLSFWARSRKIESIQIHIAEKPKESRLGLIGVKTIDFEVQERSELKAVEGFLNYPLRRAISRDAEGGPGGGLLLRYYIGEIRITTNKDNFVIGISQVGFILERKFFEIGRVFYSWGLAAYIDELLSERLGHGLPREVFAFLSGEERMDRDRRTLMKLKELRKHKERPGAGIRPGLRIAPGAEVPPAPGGTKEK